MAAKSQVDENGAEKSSGKIWRLLGRAASTADTETIEGEGAAEAIVAVDTGEVPEEVTDRSSSRLRLNNKAKTT